VPPGLQPLIDSELLWRVAWMRLEATFAFWSVSGIVKLLHLNMHDMKQLPSRELVSFLLTAAMRQPGQLRASAAAVGSLADLSGPAHEWLEREVAAWRGEEARAAYAAVLRAVLGAGEEQLRDKAAARELLTAALAPDGERRLHELEAWAGAESLELHPDNELAPGARLAGWLQRVLPLAGGAADGAAASGAGALPAGGA
jgi:hypothetical protein